MAVDVDDRKLRPGHRMLVDDERRFGAVVNDAGRRSVGRFTAPDAHLGLPRRALARACRRLR